MIKNKVNIYWANQIFNNQVFADENKNTYLEPQHLASVL